MDECGPRKWWGFCLTTTLAAKVSFLESHYHWEEDVRSFKMLSDWHETIEVAVLALWAVFLAKAFQGISVEHLQASWAPCSMQLERKVERMLAWKVLCGIKKSCLASIKMHRLFPSPENCGIYFFFLYSAQLQLKGLCSCFKNMTCIATRAQESLTLWKFGPCENSLW